MGLVVSVPQNVTQRGYGGSLAPMAQVVNVKVVCDVCGNPRRSVKPYRVAQDGSSVRVMLCKEHARPVDELLKIGERIPDSSPKVKIYSMEDIAALARAQKKRKPPSGQR